MTKYNRNAPCRCGSGKKYKQCCLGKKEQNFAFGEQTYSMNAADEFISKFMAANGDGPFSSIDELQTSLSQFQNQENSRARSEFLGLSSDLVFRLRRQTIDEMPDIVKLHFDEQQSEYGRTPVIVIALAIMLAIRQDEFLKATAKGNLPRKAVRFIFENVSAFLFYPGDGQPNREEDVYHIFKVRILLQRSGVISLRKGKFTLSRKGKEFFDDFADTDCAVKMYRHLLLFFAHKFNWLFCTRFNEELAELQNSA
ncbi:MAG: SEC-C domain-containing protein, partial [Deltaproteobacteria bacterium]|nr:SEC-C domain-containing protein [Deltaproteobacteria bacterium]